MPAGVYRALKKDNTQYYRTSITFRNKHISLGSFSTEKEAAAVYEEAQQIFRCPEKYYVDTDTGLTSFDQCSSEITFEKFILLLNFRDNKIYFKTPIYLCQRYFLYFLQPHCALIFDADDCFYYAKHQIQTRGGYYFVNDFGIQTSILSRYGIRPHSVSGRDYIFRNGNPLDYRYENIQVMNPFHGVRQITQDGRTVYTVRIHINGDYIVGSFLTEKEAAIAYNKAADLVSSVTGIEYARNYIEDLSSVEYASIYNQVLFQRKFRHYIRALTEE